MSASIESIELRKVPRDAVTMRARYSGASIAGVHDIDVTDLTAAGAGLLLDRPLCPGQLIDLHLDGGVTRDATVRWVQRVDAGFRIGVEFRPANAAAA